MIIIPEIKTVVILVPRTGSGSLRRAVAAKYPQSMLIYRHMEADGIPHGYDRWRKVAVVRDPVDRLWSLYKFLKWMDGPHEPDYIAWMRRSVEIPFSEWIVKNETVFTSPYDRAGKGRFWPLFTCLHPIPENWKSQQVYIRPDLGTQIFQYKRLDLLAAELGITLDIYENRTGTAKRPAISTAALNHVERVFAWDLTYTEED